MAPDCILAIGGGSTSDAAKTVAVLLAEGKHAADHVIKFVPPDQWVTPPLRRPKVPIISVPTTFSAGEITGAAGVLLGEGTKRTIWDNAVGSKAVIFAMDELLTVPRTLLASSAMNALAHCAELLYSVDRNVFTTSLSIAGTRGLSQALLDLSGCNGDEYRERLSMISRWAAVSGVVLANGRVGLHHAIAQQLGAVLGASHSGSNAVILPAVLKLNYEMAPESCQVMLHAFDSTSPSDLYERVSRIRDTSGATTRLRDLNIDRDGLELVASVTLNDRSYRANPAHPSKEQVHDLLESVW
jgi:alcohol dehydrogenase class IV